MMPDLSVFDTFLLQMKLSSFLKTCRKSIITLVRLRSHLFLRDVKTKPALRLTILYSICISAYLSHIHTHCLGVKNSVLYSHDSELKRNKIYCTNWNVSRYKNRCCGSALSASTNQIQLPSSISSTSVSAFTSCIRTCMFICTRLLTQQKPVHVKVTFKTRNKQRLFQKVGFSPVFTQL